MILHLAYKSFSKISHIGLGVTALATLKVLRGRGHTVTATPYQDIQHFLSSIDSILHPPVLRASAPEPPDHVIISAVWMTIQQLTELVNKYPETTFILLCHSNIAFLHADPGALAVLVGGIELQQGTHNFKVACNTERLATWFKSVYHQDVLYLPNLYDLTGMNNYPPRQDTGGPLKIGCFCAARIQKNILTAAAAALAIAKAKQRDLEFCINCGRDNVTGIINSVGAMYKLTPSAKLIQVPWSSWSQFRTTLATMHLGLQPSYTESFNNVVADGIYVGVPSVVSEPIVDEWAPKSWLGPIDYAIGISRIGLGLIGNGHAVIDGRNALTNHVNKGISLWEKLSK